MLILGKITLKSDENGLIALQCERCKSGFKMDCNYLNNELDDNICCPVCGISGSLNSFYPEEAMQAASEIGMMGAGDVLKEVCKNLNIKDYKINIPQTNPQDRNIVIENKACGMQRIKVPCCQKEIALMPANLTSEFYCPYCGKKVALRRF